MHKHEYEYKYLHKCTTIGFIWYVYYLCLSTDTLPVFESIGSANQTHIKKRLHFELIHLPSKCAFNPYLFESKIGNMCGNPQE